MIARYTQRIMDDLREYGETLVTFNEVALSVYRGYADRDTDYNKRLDTIEAMSGSVVGRIDHDAFVRDDTTLRFRIDEGECLE